MQDHQPPQPEQHWSEKLARIDGSVHADVPVPASAAAPGYMSLTGLRFGHGPFHVADHVAKIGTAFITLAPGIEMAVRSEEQARALIDAAAKVAAIFAHAGVAPAAHTPRHRGALR